MRNEFSTKKVTLNSNLKGVDKIEAAFNTARPSLQVKSNK
jgi:hypothetical protein